MSKQTAEVLHEVFGERSRQDALWGTDRTIPDGTGERDDAVLAEASKRLCDAADASGDLTWRHILEEEVYEAFAEKDARKLRTELLQVAAVAAAWIEDLDRRNGKPKPLPRCVPLEGCCNAEVGGRYYCTLAPNHPKSKGHIDERERVMWEDEDRAA